MEKNNISEKKYTQAPQRFVVLHSNDIHADFQGSKQDEKLVGGISRLSGYLKKVREEFPPEKFMYLISGDMFRGSLIDSEFVGLPTVGVINALKPDAVCIGNHEIDYGITHSLLLEKIADFPVINCNVYVRFFNKRLYNPYYIKTIGKSKVLFIGVITEELSHQLLMDQTAGPYFEVRDPAEEINKVLDELDLSQFTMIVILSHIGIDADIELAKKLDPEKISAIIGGHSHTLMDKPRMVNNIPIVQAGTGTGQIGRFDVWYHPEDGSLDHYDWETVRLDEDVCPEDPFIQDAVDQMQQHIDSIYSQPVCSISEKAVNNTRNMPTPLTCFFADQIEDDFGVDLALLNAGIVRSWGMGPDVTKMDIKEAFPYKAELYKIRTNIGALRKMLNVYYSQERDWTDTNAAVLVQSKALNCIYSEETGEIIQLTLNGEEVDDEYAVFIGINDFLIKNALSMFGEEMDSMLGKGTMISPNVIEEIERNITGKENIQLHSADRFRRILKDGSVISTPEDIQKPMQ